MSLGNKRVTSSYEFLDDVIDVLCEMPIVEAKATTLRYLGGLSFEEVALHLEIEPEMAAQLAHSGLRQLHEARIIS